MIRGISVAAALILIGVFGIPARCHAQYTRFLVSFRDKGNNDFLISDPAPYLSNRAIQRRIRYSIAIDSSDLPVSRYYLDSLKKLPGITVLSASKWLNKALIRVTDANDLNQLQTISFIKSTEAVALRRKPADSLEIQNKFREEILPIPSRQRLYGIRTEQGEQEFFNYGNSYPQIHVHEGDFLHQKGFTGRSMLIAVLDAGFQSYTTNKALDSTRMDNRIVAAYDFVADQPGVFEGNMHGANCLSIMAANRPGVIVGSSPHAGFLLLRTENAAEEYPIEEYFWARGAEFADSSGADIISSSLGYTSFDDGAFNHSYPDRNGNTCLSTIAADQAARKGLLVCNSVGNNGGSSSDEKYVSAPADGDSVVAIGAVQTNLQIAGFSSWGPNSAGKIKPNLVSIGQGTVLANGVGDAVSGNGTSYSNPNLAGLFACLWQAFPEFSNMEILDAVQRSADRFSNPDDRYGYGLPNFRVAYERLLALRNERNFDNILGPEWIRAFPNPFGPSLNIFFRSPLTGKAIIRLFDAKGSRIESAEISVTSGQKVQFEFPRTSRLPKGIYFIEYRDASRKAVLRVVKNQ